MDTKKTKSNQRRRRSVLYWIVLLLLLGIFIFSLAQIVHYFHQMHNSQAEQAQIVDEYVAPVDEPDPEQEPEVKETEEEPEELPPEPEEIQVDFARLQAAYPDVVGYIYCANTAYQADTGSINFPVVQGSDNSFYLDHGVDGRKNSNGAIFMDYTAQKDYSDQNTVIYGHRMWSGRMFAPLLQYKMQSFYEAHPYLYLYTPAQDYRLEVLAGCNVESVDAVYRSKLSTEKVQELMQRSGIRSHIRELPENAQYVTLSTCDKNSSYQDPRFIVLCLLTPIS